jgi:hypothetical protein
MGVTAEAQDATRLPQRGEDRTTGSVLLGEQTKNNLGGQNYPPEENDREDSVQVDCTPWRMFFTTHLRRPCGKFPSDAISVMRWGGSRGSALPNFHKALS